MMKSKPAMTRRDFLQYAGVGSLLLVANPFSILESNTIGKFESTGSTDFEPDLEFSLRAAPGEVQIFSGRPTSVWQFHGEVLKGDPQSLQTLEDTYLGPVFRVRKGQKIRVHFYNEIPEVSIVHFHGMHVPAVMDGHPRYVVPKGGKYVYEFEVRNRAGTYWYHPHPHGRTGPQVYNGMAGFFLVSDSEDDRLPLPRGAYDIPLVLQDRTFDNKDQLVYLGGGRMMGGMMGRLAAPSDSELREIVDYLQRHARAAIDRSQYPDLDTQEGKAFQEVCAQCHALPDPRQHSAEEWPMVVARMQRNMTVMGRRVPDDRVIGQIVMFLQRHAKGLE